MLSRQWFKGNLSSSKRGGNEKVIKIKVYRWRKKAIDGARGAGGLITSTSSRFNT